MNTKSLLTKAALTAGAIGILAGAGATAASAATTTPAAYRAPVRVAVGSIELGGPLQYDTFVALQGFGHNHGYVNYTNFNYPETGSGVWVPAGETSPSQVTSPIALTFNGSYVHTLNGGLVLKALSNDRLAFTGTGSYNTDPSAYPWTIKGQVKGDKVSFTIVYGGTGNPGYKVVAKGTIASDGSVSGTAATFNKNGTPAGPLTWAMPAGSFTSVLHIVTPIRSDRFNVGTRTVTYTWSGAPAAGIVTSKVHEGRTQAHDTYAHGVLPWSLTSFPVLAGHLQIP
jgi:hypothetical protein